MFPHFRFFITEQFFCFEMKSREGTCAEVLKSVGANGHLIHPFDNVNVIAGQGTIGLEVLEQVCNSSLYQF